MVCDIQGCAMPPPRGAPGQGREARVRIVLTDPTIVTACDEGSQYGSSDIGVQGLRNFFGTHTCNGTCRLLGLPAVEQARRAIAPSESRHGGGGRTPP